MPSFKRKPNRVPGFDYNQIGYYFITICTINKKHYFGEIYSNEMFKNTIGNIAENYLCKIPNVYEDVYLDDYVIMPNHIHVIIALTKKINPDISRIIKHYKECITKELGYKIWQKSFYDHVIRNEKDYLRIYEYIEENVLKWSLDKYYDE